MVITDEWKGFNTNGYGAKEMREIVRAGQFWSQIRMYCNSSIQFIT